MQENLTLLSRFLFLLFQFLLLVIAAHTPDHIPRVCVLSPFPALSHLLMIYRSTKHETGDVSGHGLGEEKDA